MAPAAKKNKALIDESPGALDISDRTADTTTTQPTKPSETNETIVIIAYVLSRIDFVLAHIAFLSWIVFVTNDALDFRNAAPSLSILFNTLDVDKSDIVPDSGRLHRRKV